MKTLFENLDSLNIYTYRDAEMLYSIFEVFLPHWMGWDIVFSDPFTIKGGVT